MTSEPRPTFFIDWCLGKSVSRALIEAGAQIEHHGDHFAQNTPDTVWLQVVGDRGWVVLTKDGVIGMNALELIAIAHAGARVFILVPGNLPRQQMANLFVEVLPKLEKFNQSNPSPFIAKLYRDGRIVLWRKHTQLLKLVRRDQLPGLS